jgi:hypothetical protein
MTWNDFFIMMGIAIVVYYVVVGAYILLHKRKEKSTPITKQKDNTGVNDKARNKKNFINKKMVGADDIVFEKLNTNDFYNDDQSILNNEIEQNPLLADVSTEANTIREDKIILSNEIIVTENGQLNNTHGGDNNNAIYTNNIDSLVQNSINFNDSFITPQNSTTENIDVNPTATAAQESITQHPQNQFAQNTNTESQIATGLKNEQHPKKDSLLHLIKTKTT